MQIIELKTEYDLLLNLDPTIPLIVDLETTGLDWQQDKILDIFATQDGNLVFLIDKTLAENLLQYKIVGHNFKFDLKFLSQLCGKHMLELPYTDTILLGHLVDENRDSYALDSYIKDITNDDYKKKFWDTYKTYQEAPRSQQLDYAGKDVVYTLYLYQDLLKQLKHEEIPSSLVEHVHKLQYALLNTEVNGIEVDMDYLVQKGIEINSKIQELRPKIMGLVASEIELIEFELWSKELDKRKTDKGKSNVQKPKFNIDSSKQLQELLYDKLQLTKQYNEKTKAVSTDDASLEKLRDEHPVISLIQDYRALNKVYTAYIEGTLEKVKNGTTIYPEFRVHGTVTGRISHSNPNLGQLPANGGIRGIYKPRTGNVFISADYSQLEVCVEANLTGDEELRKIFTEGRSKHDTTAEGLGIDRYKAKTLNFALQYWASHYKVAKILGVSEQEAKKIWDGYWELYKGPKNLKQETDRKVNQGVPLVTHFGRKRRFDIKKRNQWDSDYRQAYNFLIQSIGADLTSMAFYRIAEELKRSNEGRALFTVHDEVLIEVLSNKAQYWDKRLKEIMVDCGDLIGLQIRLKAESSGPMDRWED